MMVNTWSYRETQRQKEAGLFFWGGRKEVINKRKRKEGEERGCKGCCVGGSVCMQHRYIILEAEFSVSSFLEHYQLVQGCDLVKMDSGCI